MTIIYYSTGYICFKRFDPFTKCWAKAITFKGFLIKGHSTVSKAFSKSTNINKFLNKRVGDVFVLFCYVLFLSFVIVLFFCNCFFFFFFGFSVQFYLCVSLLSIFDWPSVVQYSFMRNSIYIAFIISSMICFYKLKTLEGLKMIFNFPENKIGNFVKMEINWDLFLFRYCR